MINIVNQFFIIGLFLFFINGQSKNIWLNYAKNAYILDRGEYARKEMDAARHNVNVD